MRAAVLIDGGHLRAIVRKNNTKYDPSYIEKVAHACVEPEESLLRILYYDCAPYQGKVKLPVSGIEYTFTGNDRWLKNLAAKDYFAVRLGVLKFRGYKPKQIPITPATLRDDDFKPDFEQKGVDMRIGLDMATISESKSVDRLILITADTDCIPAMKHCRKEGLQVVLVSLQNQRLPPELLWHADFERRIAYPSP